MCSIAVGRIGLIKCCETMQGSKTGAVAVDLDHRAIARTAAIIRRPIQSLARQKQIAKRMSAVTVGISRSRDCLETIKGREGLCPYPANRNQVKTRDQRGHEGKTDNLRFHGLMPWVAKVGEWFRLFI